MKIELNDSVQLNLSVNDRLFGGNFLAYTDRAPYGTFDDVATNLGLTSARYPGGTVAELYFDINDPDSGVGTHIITGEQIVLTPLSSFIQMMNGMQMPVSIVIPTLWALDGAATGERDVRASALEDVKRFVTDVLAGVYGEAQVSGFEIGNEYWGGGSMTAVEYGRVASAMSKAVQEAIDDYRVDAGMPEWWNEPLIGVQFGQRGDLDQTAPHIQNRIIMNEFNQEEADAVDAVIGHFFTHGGPEKIRDMAWFFDRLDVWDGSNKFGDVERWVTEWNSHQNLSTDTGLLHAQAVLQSIVEFVQTDIDLAQVWGVQINSRNDLSSGEGTTTLTLGGEMFRLISESAKGAELDHLFYSDKASLYAFDRDHETSLFLTNPTGASMGYSIDLSFLEGEIESVGLTTITTPGNPLAINGRAVLEYHQPLYNYDGVFRVDLGAYEISRLVVSYAGQDENEFPQSISGGPEIAETRSGNAQANLLIGYAGNDQLNGMSGEDTLDGGDGDDVLRGGDQADLILGGNGNDIVYGGFGQDEVYLGAGDDSFIDIQQGGFWGADTIYGGAGNDAIQCIAGNDFVSGGDGEDWIWGGRGNNLLYGDAGADSIFGGNGNDTIHGGAGNDSLYGGGDNDLITGGGGSDRIFGNSGNDSLFGGIGDDFLRGEQGNDYLSGGAGNDTLEGNAGADTYAYKQGFGQDVIVDFDPLGGDRIEISGFDLSDPESVFTSFQLSQSDQGAVLDFGNGDTLTLNGFQAAALTSDMFSILH